MDKRSEFSAALKTALLEKDQIAVSTVRLILAALKDRDIAARDKGCSEGIKDDDILLMLQSMIKQRQESSKTYSEAGRDDLAEREELEIDIIRQFLPRQLSEDEISEIVDSMIEETGAESVKDMGKIMGVLKGKYAGQMDMSKVGAIVRGKLS